MQVFDKILIANRGEIAVRIARTLGDMGIKTVAVYSDADAKAPHVGFCDEAVRLGPADARESYLKIDAVVQAAVDTGAQAIHPGYGFLSENPAFARACADAGIEFVGPSAEAIEIMGDKIAARKAVEARGVPTVPGIVGASDDEILARAEDIGFPMIVKPAMGGGGKGMHVARTLDELRDALPTARRESGKAFGDETVFVERFIERPRHIEVQVMADKHGNVVHLGERECSLQRRHQKVIEEAPSAFLSPEQRERYGQIAIETARSVDYVGAGTVEFIVASDAPDEPYFLEMNTRLQVEHPVTEEVTGLDLVELMTTIAAGQPLPLEQTDVVLTGHSIEARIYAEDPNEGFLPTGGTIVRLRQPHYDDPRIRFDSGVEEGSVVSSNYDPMLAKVIATGETRDEALATLQEGLAHLFIAGVVTNVGFLTTLLARDEVVAGEIDTEFIDRNVESLTDSRVPTAAYAKAALAVSGPSSNRIGTAWQADGWRIGGPAEIRSRLADATVFIDPRTMQTRVVADDPATLMPDTDNEPSGFATFGWTSYEDRHPTGTHVDDDAVWVQLHGHTYRVERRRAAEAALAEGEAAITAPMPGAVVAIAVADGDTVEVGQHVLSVEAMKMEHKLMATQAGVVRLEVAEGEQVTRGQLLAHIEAAESANGGMQ